MTISLVNSFKTAGGVAAGTYALGFTPTVGNTLIVGGHMTASVNTLTSMTLGAGRSFTQHDTSTDPVTSENVYCFSRIVQSGDASSITFTTSAGNTFFYVLELSGALTPEVSGFESATHVNNGSGSVHSSAFTSLNNNDFVLALNRYSGSVGTISNVTNGYIKLTNGRANTDFFYSLDVGASGSKTFSWTSSVITNVAHIYLFKSAVVDPTVISTSNNSNTEGSAIVHSITLSGTTSNITNYAATLIGVNATGGGTDFTSDLSSATYSNGVTFSGGNMVVPIGVSDWNVTISTSSDTIDESDETYTLIVGGVSGIGTILDDDSPPTYILSDAVESFGTCTFTITLAQASGKTITMNYATANGNKIAGVDYVATSGTLTFNPGETVKTVVVNTL